MNSSNHHTFSSPEVFVVEASAGSGKTYALAKRYVQLVLNPSLHKGAVPIRTILALTFTNKAAFEMKARILQFLKKIALKDVAPREFENIVSPLGLSLDQASDEAFAAMDYLIRNYNFFQVQTIDKFINALLSGCAFKIGLTSGFRIKTNSQEYLLYSLDQMIDDALDNASMRGLLESFLHQYLYIENRSGWFPKEDILAIISSLFAQYNTYGKPLSLSKTTIDELIKKKKYILDLMNQLKTLLPADVDARFRKALDSFLKKHTRGFDIDTLSEYFAREDLPLRKNATASREVHALWSRIHKNLKQLCEEEAYSLFNPYIAIFEQIRKNFIAFSAHDDVLFLEELNSKAASLFDEDYVTVEELYYRLATRFHHYLVDEFQDTSRLQWHNLEKMVEEALSTGGSLFYVGDKKQAIYGFRGGESALFDTTKERFSMFNVKTDILSKNWRSHKAIVEFNNTVFALSHLRDFISAKEKYEQEKNKKNAVVFNEQDLEEIDAIFKDSQQSGDAAHDQGYVRMEVIDAEKRQDCNEQVRAKVLALIGDLKKRFEYRDMAILTRGNKEIEMMTNWLLEQNIPVESERTSNIKENALIQEIMAFLQFLNSPIDNVAFTQFILGSFFAKAVGAGNQELHAFVFGLRDKLRREKDFYLYTEFRKTYPLLWKDYIDEFFRNVGLYPLYELVMSLYSRFNILSHFAEDQGFLMHLLELIRLQEEESSDVDSFLNYYDRLAGEKLYVEVTDANAVKLLTIHKSKGLEFPVVILPFLGMDVQVGSSNANYQQSYILHEEPEAISLFRLKSKYYSFSDELYHIYREEYKKAFISELNNIYVALTRPCCELYGFIPKKAGNAFNFVQLLIPPESFVNGKPVHYDFAQSQKQAIVSLAPSRCRDWIAYLVEEFPEETVADKHAQRRRGDVLHFMLALVENLKEQALPDLMEEIEAKAQAQFPLFEGLGACCQCVEAVLKEATLRKFFWFEEGEAFNEKDMVNQYGDTKRIDRLMIGKDEVFIIDYKSSEDTKGRDQEQVQGYLSLVQGLYPQKNVKGFLLYLDTREVKEIDQG